MASQPLAPVQAALLSVIIPGLGHIYVGRISRYFVCLAFVLAFFTVLGASGLLARSLPAFAVAGLVAIAAYCYLAVDAALIARRSQADHLPWYSKWYGYLLFVAFAGVLAVALPDARVRLVGAGTFRVPSPSMSPTIAQGDYVMVDMHAYRTHPPQPGDVVVLLQRASGRLYIRRVQEAAEDFVLVASDNPDYGDDSRRWGSVPVTDVVGTVTFIWFSSDLARLGYVPR